METCAMLIYWNKYWYTAVFLSGRRVRIGAPSILPFKDILNELSKNYRIFSQM